MTTKQILMIALIALMIIQVALIAYGVQCLMKGKQNLGVFHICLNGTFLLGNVYNLISLQDL